MTGSEVRRSFLDFFASKDHLIVPSAPLVPKDDPTLMFTNAGMVQFKDVFLGLAEPARPRIADSQKCLRISGKHNDLEEVGRDTYHHTLFEMLGNWSFGDYYKPEAIEWAWQLLTGVWGLPKDRLYASVYRTDEEAEKLWPKITDIAPDRVLRFDEKDNFWEMGDTGPCGPCSEIHIDRGADACDMRHVKGHVCAVNEGCARYIELWNLVFIQYSRDESGTLHELPAKHVDTGMGLERVAAVLENVDGNYDGSLLRTLISTAEKASGRRYGQDPEADVSFRVLADHGRAVSFLVADGIDPGNDGRGYVLRRVLRRAARHGKALGFDRPFFYEICAAVVDSMGDAYPELSEQRARITDVVRGEEERFAETLDRGLAHLEDAVAALAGGAKTLSGDVAFRLYDTYGFPVDMTADILRGRGLELDEDGFRAAMEEQKERGRSAQSERGGARDYTLVVAAARTRGGSEFAGPFVNEESSAVVAMSRRGELIDAADAGESVEVVTARTPFYGESGGQIGDTGTIVSASGARGRVVDTQKPAPDVTVLHVDVTEGRLAVDDEVELSIDAERRQAIRLNHSATHLLHAALRARLGDGVHQQGSLVADSRLRFDFNHDGPVADEALADIEAETNASVRRNSEVTTEEMPYDDAIAAGAMAFFGDKYGDVVRVVRMGDDSIELCGGTHVARTGDIGLLQVTAETGVAAGVRRIEAATGDGALGLVAERERTLEEIARLLKTEPAAAVARVEKLLARSRDLERKIADLEQGKSKDLVGDLIAAARPFGDARAIVAAVDGVPTKSLRSLSDRLRERLGSGVVVLATVDGGKVGLLVAVTDDLASTHHAGNTVKELAPLVAGRGGGKADFAQAGGSDPSGVPALLEKANEIFG